MHPAFPVQPRRPGPPRHLIRRVFRQAKAHLAIKRHGRVDVGREHVEMVDPQRFHPVIQRIFLMDRRQPFHRRIEFQRNPHRITRRQNPPHERPFGPRHRQTLALKPLRRLVQIALVPDFEPQHPNFGRFSLFQDHAMMPAFLHRPQIDMPRVFERHLKPKHINVVRPAPCKVRHAQFDMRQTHDVERRVQIGCWNWHRVPFRVAHAPSRWIV